MHLFRASGRLVTNLIEIDGDVAGWVSKIASYSGQSKSLLLADKRRFLGGLPELSGNRMDACDMIRARRDKMTPVERRDLCKDILGALTSVVGLLELGHADKALERTQRTMQLTQNLFLDLCVEARNLPRP